MDSTKPKLLCVDDEPEVLKSLERLLRSDFEVTTASNTSEALQYLEVENNYSIVLSDFRMPEKTGVELLSIVKKKYPTTVRAILSGQIDVSHIAHAINNAEIHRFMLKPWDNDYLKLQMQEAYQTHLRLKEKQLLEKQATTDPVTGLSNHRYFKKKLKDFFDDSKQKGEPLSVVMIDVDHFKSYNDRYGHPEGDRLLFNIGQRMIEYFSPPMVLSRYGGEEFAVLVPSKRANETYELAEKLRVDIESHPFPGPYGKPTYVTISIGIAETPSFNRSFQELLEAADRALYQSKHQGRNQTKMAYAAPQAN